MPKILFCNIVFSRVFPWIVAFPCRISNKIKYLNKIGKPRFKRCILAQCSGIGWFIFNLTNAEFLHTVSAQYPASCGFFRLDAMLRRERNYCEQSFASSSSMHVHVTPMSKRQMTSLSFVLQETIAKQQLCTYNHTFFCTFLSRFCTTTTWKCLISCLMENVN